MAESLWHRVLFPGRHRHSEGTNEPPLPRVLAITVSASDHSFYSRLRGHGEWNVVITQTITEALCFLSAQVFPIVLCDRDLPGQDWREVLTRIVESSPGICFLLTSRVSDEYLWREVVMLGGYDVVAKPLAEQAVLQTLQRAMYYRRTEPRQPKT